MNAGRPEMVRTKRRQHEVVQVGGEAVHVRDQAPLHAGNTRLATDWTFEDFVQYLNEKVFFWPGTSDGPIAYGVRHYERYRVEAPAIIRVPTASIFDANCGFAPLFCRYNSGSPRCSNGQPSPRSLKTFSPADEVEFAAALVVEVVYEQAAVLPGDAEIGQALAGPWRRMW